MVPWGPWPKATNVVRFRGWPPSISMRTIEEAFWRACCKTLTSRPPRRLLGPHVEALLIHELLATCWSTVVNATPRREAESGWTCKWVDRQDINWIQLNDCNDLHRLTMLSFWTTKRSSWAHSESMLEFRSEADQQTHFEIDRLWRPRFHHSILKKQIKKAGRCQNKRKKPSKISISQAFLQSKGTSIRGFLQCLCQMYCQATILGFWEGPSKGKQGPTTDTAMTQKTRGKRYTRCF